jgi:hypothetical protein
MRSNRPLLLSIVALALSGCLSDAVAPRNDAFVPMPPVLPALTTLRGIVTVEGIDADARIVSIRPIEGGAAVILIGGPVNKLAQLEGAEVSVWGTNDAIDALVAEGFELIAMNGMPARDGVLIEVQGGYALRRWNGTLQMVVDPPSLLLATLGLHVWLAGPDSQAPVEYGVFLD